MSETKRTTELKAALKAALGMLKMVGFDESCDAAFERAWRMELKRLNAVLRAKPR